MTRRGAREGSIRERSDGTFEARVVVEGKRLSLYGKTRREVQQKLSEAKPSAAQGKLIGQSRQTVSQCLDHWLTDHVSLCRRPRTVESYSLNVTRINQHLGHLDSRRFTSSAATLSSWSRVSFASTLLLTSASPVPRSVPPYLRGRLRTFQGRD